VLRHATNSTTAKNVLNKGEFTLFLTHLITDQ